VSEKTELGELRKANAAMNQQLTSGFYPMPYFEPGRPLTPGVAAGPDVQMYARPVDAYGAYRPSFYSPPGYTQCVYPNGVQYTPVPEAQRFGHPDKAFYAYPYGMTHPSQEVEIRQVDRVSSDRQQSADFSRQPEMDIRTATTRPVVQFSDTTSENMVARPDSGPQQNTTATSQARTPETGSDEIETIETVYHTARRDNPSCKEEPEVELIQRTKERKVLQYDSEESDDDDVAAQRHPKRKAETDAKVGATRHSSRHSNGTSKRAGDPVDAKVGSTQHSPPKKSHSSTRDAESRTDDRTACDKKRQSASTTRDTSTEDRRRNRKKNSSRMDEPYSPSDPSMSSSEEEVVTPRHLMKPPKFDGQCSFETFMVQFSNCAEYNKWNEAQKLAHLRNLLEKDAATILWDYGTETTTSWKGLTEILETRFGGKAMSEKYRIELRHRWRAPDEMLQSLHADIRRLAALAYKGVPLEVRDQVTCDSFLDALGNAELAFKIRERQPSDLDSALRIALQLEVWAKEMNRHHESPWPERAEGRRVREINRKDESYKNQDMNSKRHTGYPRGTARNQGASAGGYRPPAPARYAAPNAHGGPAPPRPRGQYPANYGRAEVAQPSGGYGNRNGNLYQTPVMFPGCYNCGDPSHRTRECPTRPDRPTTQAPQVATPRQPDVRPMKRRSDKP